MEIIFTEKDKNLASFEKHLPCATTTLPVLNYGNIWKISKRYTAKYYYHLKNW